MPKAGWIEFNDSHSTLGNECFDSDEPKEKRNVRVQRTRTGKGGKLVTVISGLQLNKIEAKNLLKRLKIFCGTGGTIKENCLELQGDQLAQALAFLNKEGFRPKQSGG